METKVMKWGNSHGIRLPKSILEEVLLKDGDRVDISVKKGAIVISIAKPRYEIKRLLSNITEKNQHAEISSGQGRGREEW